MPAALAVDAGPRRAHGSVIYLHGVGGVRESWWEPVAQALSGVTVDLVAPEYRDLLTTRGRVYARRAPADETGYTDVDRQAYVERQRRLADLVDAVGESTRLTWPSSLPHPSDLADRLPLASVLRSPLFGLDQAGRYVDDEARRAAVVARATRAILHAPRPRVVVGHSLGSLVAWDVLADPRVEVDLLITLGSPLASPMVREAAERHVLGAFPYARLGSWLNVVHLLDPVPAGRGLRDAFPAACDAYLSPMPAVKSPATAVAGLATALSRLTTSHLDSTYLSSRTVLAAVRSAMQVTDAVQPRVAS